MCPLPDRVLEDVAKRYPIDPERIYVSGYSFGGAMAWRYVCQSGNDVAALLAVAGSIRQTEDLPTSAARGAACAWHWMTR